MTTLLYNPITRKGTGHCPINKLSFFLPISCKVSETAMQPSAAHRKTSEGILAVCSSIADATFPSLCSGLEAICPTPAVRAIINRFSVSCGQLGLFHISLFQVLFMQLFINDHAGFCPLCSGYHNKMHIPCCITSNI